MDPRRSALYAVYSIPIPLTTFFSTTLTVAVFDLARIHREDFKLDNFIMTLLFLLLCYNYIIAVRSAACWCASPRAHILRTSTDQ